MNSQEGLAGERVYESYSHLLGCMLRHASWWCKGVDDVLATQSNVGSTIAFCLDPPATVMSQCQQLSQQLNTSLSVTQHKECMQSNWSCWSKADSADSYMLLHKLGTGSAERSAKKNVSRSAKGPSLMFHDVVNVSWHHLSWLRTKQTKD